MEQPGNLIGSDLSLQAWVKMLKTKATEAFCTSFSNQANDPFEGKSPESVGIKFCNGLPDSKSPSTGNS